MANLKRYGLVVDTVCECDCDMVANKQGEWVKFEDITKTHLTSPAVCPNCDNGKISVSTHDDSWVICGTCGGTGKGAPLCEQMYVLCAIDGASCNCNGDKSKCRHTKRSE